MRVVCWITNATNKYSECVIRTGFSQQQWLGQRASLLRLYVHYLSYLLDVQVAQYG